MASNVPRRRRGQSLFFTPVPDSGEATETASSVSLRAAGNMKKQARAREGQSQSQAGSSGGGGSSNFHRSSSSPLISQAQRGPSWSSAGEVLALPRSHSNLYFRPQLLPQPLSESIFADEVDQEDDIDDDELDPPLLLRRTASQSRAAASSIVPLTGGMARRRVPAELGEDPRIPSRTRTPLNGQSSSSNGKSQPEDVMPLDKHPILIGITGSSIHFNVNMEKVTPLLFQCLRTLAVIPAGVETLKLLAGLMRPRAPNTSLDYIASAAWSILTAYQALCFTTGLLARWRHYYPLTATLIRLVGLQAICWPATFYTLRLLQYDGVERPLVCWSVIGTTTCITRSIQMWVTSNIDEWHRDQDGAQYSAHTVASIALGFGEKKVLGGNETEQEEVAQRQPPIARQQVKGNGNTKVRKWNWNEVVWKCAFPAGVCYFFMAWAMLLSREVYPCRVSPHGHEGFLSS